LLPEQTQAKPDDLSSDNKPTRPRRYTPPIRIESSEGVRDVQSIVLTKMAAKSLSVRQLAWAVGLKTPVRLAHFLNRSGTRGVASIYLLRIFRYLGIKIEGELPQIADHPNMLAALRGEKVPANYSKQMKPTKKKPEPVTPPEPEIEYGCRDKYNGRSWV
jgi:hypothetical protein